MRTARLLAICVALFALLPSAASAATVQEIVTLSKAGVAEEVILALIERDRSIFALDPDQLMMLANEGVSQPVILAMLRSGRQEPPPAAATDAQQAAASDGPTVVIFGHGPTRPNTYHEYDNFPGYRDAPTVYFVPVAVVPMAVPAFAPCATVPLGSPATRLSTAANHTGRFISDPSARFLSDGSQRFLSTGVGAAAPASAAMPVIIDCSQDRGRPARAERHRRR